MKGAPPGALFAFAILFGVAAEDVQRLREGYEAFNRGEPVDLMSQVTEGFVAYDRPELPDPQVRHGQEGAQEALASVTEGFDEYEIVPEEFIDAGEHVVVVCRQRARGEASGAEVEGTIVHVWTLRDGRVAALHAFSSKEDALAHIGWPSS